MLIGSSPKEITPTICVAKKVQVRILVISQSFLPRPCAGAEILAHHEMLRFARTPGVKPLLFASRTSIAIRENLPYGVVNYWPGTFSAFRSMGTTIASAYLSSQLSALQKKHRFDVWHVHFAEPFAPVVARLARRFGVPCVMTPHGSDILRVNSIPGYGLDDNASSKRDLAASISFFSKVVAISKTMRSALENFGFPPDVIADIPNGVDLELFSAPTFVSPADFRKKFDIPESSFVLFCSARNSPEKGLPHLLEALKIMLERRSDIVCIFAGDGTNHLQEVAERIGVANYCRFLGSLRPDFTRLGFSCPSAEIAEIHKHADIFALPSLSESFGLAALEAMASGTPIVASDVGGLKDFIVNDANGLLVPPGNSKALAYAMLSLMKNKKLREKLTSNARNTAERYSWSRIFNDYLELFAELRDERSV